MDVSLCSLHEFIDNPENSKLDLTVFDDLYVPDFKTSSTNDRASDSGKVPPNPPRQHNEIVNGAKAADDSVGARGR